MSRLKSRLKSGLQAEYKLPKLIVILGPTASGKTDLALKLARKLNGEVVNADSRQIYRGMDIGTGKVEADERRYKRRFTQIIADGVPHYLIDIINPDEEFTVADYKKMAVAAILDILKRGKAPFLVGGTGLYIQAVVDNLEIPVVPPNKKLRTQFEKELAAAPSPPPGLEVLRAGGQPSPRGERGFKIQAREKVIEKWYKKLLKLDPGARDTVDKNNPRRIIRAIEVCLATRQPFSKLREKGEPLFDVLQIGIAVPREELYERIDKRVDRMIKDGLVEETKNLVNKLKVKSYKLEEIWRLPAMSGIGYKEAGKYLSEKLKVKSEKLRKDILENKIQEIKWRTHGYARRQMTWFRKDKRIKWVKNYKEAEGEIVKWLNCHPAGDDPKGH